jgi:threonine/homoserine/homoserine lactone efflux protein
MVIPSRLVEYIIAAMIIILAPGPSVLFVIARAIAWGRRVAVFTVAGNVTGAFFLSSLVAFGLGPILSRSDLAYSAVQWGGGIYLVYLGIVAIKARKIAAADMKSQGSVVPTFWRSARDGFWVGALNPKGLVFYAAVLPQFVDIERGNVTGQLLLLGALFSILAFISDGSWGLLAGTARAWLASDEKRLELLRVIGGCVMIILGLLVIASALRDLITT